MGFYSPPAKNTSPSSSDTAEELLTEINHRLDQLEIAKADIQKLRDDYINKLSEVSGLAKEEAKKILLDEAQKYYASDLA